MQSLCLEIPKGWCDPKLNEKTMLSNLVVFDTAGSDRCIPEEAYVEKKATEAFLREMVIMLSSVLFIVVNRLRLSDQDNINDVLGIVRRRNKDVRIIIVHNLNDVMKEEDVDGVIEEEIVRCLKAKRHETVLKEGVCCTYFKSLHTGESANDEIHVNHYIMAREGSAAGAKWNGPTKEAINNKLQANDSFRKLELFQSIINFAASRLPDLLRDREEVDLVVFEKDGTLVIMEGKVEGAEKDWRRDDWWNVETKGNGQVATALQPLQLRQALPPRR